MSRASNSASLSSRRSEWKGLELNWVRAMTNFTPIPSIAFPFANANGFLDPEWGIKQGNRQEGGSKNAPFIGGLTILGEEGNDRLFGGFEADEILGGAGADFIAGDQGNDRLDGGADRDLVLGDTGIPHDRFEAVTRDATTAIGLENGFNTSLLFSSLISPFDDQGQLQTLSQLTFNIGDAGDWYLIPAPAADETFGGSMRAVFSHDDITVAFDAPTDQTLFEAPANGAPMNETWDSDNYSLFAGVQTDPNAELSFLPVEQFNGVPDFYLIHVNNVKAYGIRGSAAPSLDNLAAPIAVTFNLTIDGVTSEDVTVNLDPTIDTDTTRFSPSCKVG